MPGPSCYYNIFDPTDDPYGCYASGLNCAAIEPWCKDKNPKFQMNYENQLSTMRSGGCQFFRYVNFEDRMEIEFEKLNNYYYRLDNAWELDRLIDHCKEIDMSMIFVLDHHLSWTQTETRFWFDFSPNVDDDSNKGYNIYNCNPDDDGYCYSKIPGVNSPKDMLTNPVAMENYQHRLRYYISRYGYSNKIAMFELVSEINNINTSISNYNSEDGCCNDIFCNFSDPLYPVVTTYKWPGDNTNDISSTANYDYDFTLPSLVYQWQNEMSCYLHQQLHCNQLVGASYAGYQGSAISGTHEDITGTFNPDLTYWSGCIDYVSWNDYSPSFKRYEDRFTGYQNVRVFNKPIINSEWGQNYAEGCDQDIEFYRGVWKGSLTGVAGTPMEWGSQHNRGYLFNTYGIFNDFMSGIDLRGDWTLDYEKANSDDSLNKVEVLYYRDSENGASSKVFGVIDNLTVNMKSMNTGGECFKGEYIHTLPEQIVAGGQGQSLYINNMGAFKDYYINFYNITNGSLVQTTSASADIFGRLFFAHPILWNNDSEFMYGFKAYRIEDGVFLPQIITTFKETNLENSSVEKHEQSEKIRTIFNNNQLGVTISSQTIYKTIEIYSLDGKIVESYKLYDNQNVIDIDFLSSGFYILKAIGENNIILTSQFVKL